MSGDTGSKLGSPDREGAAEGAAFRERSFLFKHSCWKYV